MTTGRVPSDLADRIAFYDRFFIDGMSTLYKRTLTNDHPADVTNDHGNLNFTSDERLSDRWPAPF